MSPRESLCFLKQLPTLTCVDANALLDFRRSPDTTLALVLVSQALTQIPRPLPLFPYYPPTVGLKQGSGAGGLCNGRIENA